MNTYKTECPKKYFNKFLLWEKKQFYNMSVTLFYLFFTFQFLHVGFSLDGEKLALQVKCL